MSISMGVLRAILLSSQNQAESFISEDPMPTLIRVKVTTRLAYRLIVRYAPPTPDEPGTYLLSIYRVTYPDAAVGKGWGEPHYAETPHKICPFTDKAAFLAYLAEMNFSAEENWSPVESETI